MARSSTTLYSAPDLLFGAATALDLYGVLGVRQSQRQYDGQPVDGLTSDQLELVMDELAFESSLPLLPKAPA